VGGSTKVPSAASFDNIRRCAALDVEYADPGSTPFDGGIVTIGNSVMSADATYALESAVKFHLRRKDIPNAALAVVSGDGRLVYAKGFTNRDAYDLAQEDVYFAGENTRFRIGSISKVLTGVATLRAMELGLFGPDLLNARVSEFVDLTSVPRAFEGLLSANPDLLDIRIRHLLLHTAGWVRDTADTDRDGFVDGVYPPVSVASTSSLRPGYDFTSELAYSASASRSTYPVTPDHLTRFANVWPLSWTPGDRVCYSNYGYFLLGRVIEGASCRSYESFVREYVLAPALMADAMIGATPRSQRAVREVPYYTEHWPWESAGWKPVEWQSVIDGSDVTDADLPSDYKPYAQRDVRLAAAPGGWIASVRDMARFCQDLFVGPSNVLSPTGLYYATLRAVSTAADGSSGWTFAGLGSGTGTSGSTGETFDIYDKSGHALGAAAYLWSAGPSSRPYAKASFVLLLNRSWSDVQVAEGDLVDSLAHVIRNLGSSGWGTGDLF
jgi:CubicO group peptidase (beta-lactamase class C family)